LSEHQVSFTQASKTTSSEDLQSSPTFFPLGLTGSDYEWKHTFPQWVGASSPMNYLAAEEGMVDYTWAQQP